MLCNLFWWDYYSTFKYQDFNRCLGLKTILVKVFGKRELKVPDSGMYEYCLILEYTSIVRYWYKVGVPVSFDTGTFFVFQYRSILEHFWYIISVPVLADTGTEFGRPSIGRYWQKIMYQYRAILVYQYLGPKVPFFRQRFY